jgi:acetyl esterase
LVAPTDRSNVRTAIGSQARLINRWVPAKMKLSFFIAVLALFVCASLDAAENGAPDSAKVFIYKKTPQNNLKLLVDYPPGWKGSDKRPAILFFFGGSWKYGSPAQFKIQATYLASRGLVAVRADYRIGTRDKTRPVDCVEDARSAMRWLRRHAAEQGIDPERIIAAGGSAGGHLAACTAFLPGPDAASDDLTVSCKPCALVLFNPVVDFTLISSLVTNAESAGLTMNISPGEFLTAGAPPAILFFGGDDKLIEQGRRFAGNSRKLGNRVEFQVAPGVGHGFFNKPPWREITLKCADEFLAALGLLQGPPTVQIPDAAKALQPEK